MSISPISSNAPISPASGVVAPTGTPKGQWFSDSLVTEQNWADLDRLSPSDRALIKSVTGQDIPTRASGKPPVAPILAFQVSGDRASGALGAGQPVSTDYIHGLIDRYRGKDNPFGDQLQKALDFLMANPPGKLDVQA